MNDNKRIKLVILDCDGVLTDGKITYNDRLIESKSFSARDGLGIKLLHVSGIEVAIITGRESEVVNQRAHDLKIKYVYQNIKNKLKFAEKLLTKLNLNWSEVAYMGDDWNDFPVVEKVGLSACPSDAAELFKEKVDFRASKNGGEGAVREFIEYLISQQDNLEAVIDNFLEELKKR